jgi:hypothetical protein
VNQNIETAIEAAFACEQSSMKTGSKSTAVNVFHLSLHNPRSKRVARNRPPKTRSRPASIWRQTYTGRAGKQVLGSSCQLWLLRRPKRFEASLFGGVQTFLILRFARF